MKTIKMKRLMMIALTVMLAVCCACIAMSFPSANTVSGSSAPDANVFEMEKGAQVALNKDGIRFIVKMGANVYDEIVTNDAEDKVSLSVTVAPKSHFDDLTGEDAGKYEKLTKKKIAIDEELIYSSKGYYYANAVLTNLNAENNQAITVSQFDYDFVGVGIITDTTSGTPQYSYTKFNGENIANNTRSQYDLLQSAILDSENPDIAETLLSNDSPYKTWFGTTDYPIVIDTAEKYESLVAQMQGLNFDNLNFEVDGSIETDELPAKVEKYHFVSFYNGAELIDTVKVYDGETANFTGTAPTKAEDFYTYTFADAWTTEDGGETTANLTSVTSSMNVYAKYTKTSPRTGDDANTVFFFNNEKGLTQIKKGINVNNIAIDTTLDANGMTKLSLSSGSKNLAQVTVDTKDYQFNEGDYVIFDVYLDVTTDATEALYLDIRLNGEAVDTYATRVLDGGWAQVLFPASALKGELLFFYSTSFNADLYIGKAKAIPASEVKDIATTGSETAYTLSGLNFVGGSYATYSGNKPTYTTVGGKVAAELMVSTGEPVFSAPTDVVPHYVNGGIRFYANNNDVKTTTYLRIALKLAEPITSNRSKVKITMRGFDISDGGVFFVNSTTQTLAGQLAFSLAQEGVNGYKTFKCDAGSRDITYDYIIISLAPHSGYYMSQGIISAITLS